MLLSIRDQLLGFVRHLSENEDGADMAEYALVLVLIAVVAIAAVTNIGTQVTSAFCDIVAGLGGAC